MDLTEIVHFDHVERHPWELARLVIIKEQLGRLLSGVKGAKTVLDIGCGDAFVVGQLAEFFPGVHFVGVDINFSEDQLRAFRQKLTGANLELHRTLDDVVLDKGSVDIVLLLDVIEHIEDEIGFMRSLEKYTYLKPTTRFLITVPAFQNLFAAHDVILGHFRRYSNKSLQNRMAQAGFATQYARYFFFSLIPPRLFQVVAEKIIPRNTETGSDLAAWKGGQGLTKFIQSILLLDYRIAGFFKKMGIKIPGLSNLAICQRSVS